MLARIPAAPLKSNKRIFEQKLENSFEIDFGWYAKGEFMVVEEVLYIIFDDLGFNQKSVYILRDLFGGGLAVTWYDSAYSGVHFARVELNTLRKARQTRECMLFSVYEWMMLLAVYCLLSSATSWVRILLM